MSPQGAVATARPAKLNYINGEGTTPEDVEAVAISRLGALRRIHDSEAVAQAALAGATAPRHRLRLLARLASLAATEAVLEAEVVGDHDEAIRFSDLAVQLDRVRREVAA